jgi:hypothetical protein
MSLTTKLLASSGGVDKLYSDSVFSAYTYVGNNTQRTITNGIDLLGKGGLVWSKSRSAAQVHMLNDTERTNALFTNSTSLGGNGGITEYTNSGYVISNTGNGPGMNNSPEDIVSWTFRKAPKFFDVVTYTGNGVAGRQIPHELGIAPGMVICKATSTTSNWPVYHRSLSANNALTLNSTSAAAASSAFGAPTDSVFTAGNNPNYINENGVQYVAYLFAHDDSEDGIVQCGTKYAGYGQVAEVNLGWEAQFAIIKPVNQGGGNWQILDTARGWANTPETSGDDAQLNANTSNSESLERAGNPISNGFKFKGFDNNGNGGDHIYIAIRRSNKPPKLGTEVYSAIARTGTGAAATVTGVGFAPDLAMFKSRNSAGSDAPVFDRLRGRYKELYPNGATAETTSSEGLISLDQDGVTLGIRSSVNNSGTNFVNHFFKRAVGVFDEVCYTGTGAATTVQHGLGVPPELIIVKIRNSSSYNWAVYHSGLGATKRISFNTTDAAATTSVYWNNTNPTNSVFNVGTDFGVNGAAATMVAYLFASKAGISKVFSYTGNGSSQTIDCGFTTGARFCMIKRTDSTGDWYVWSTATGIVASNDPHLSLNTTATEVTTDDSVDPNLLGFDINQNTATNINVTSGTYIGLAFA